MILLGIDWGERNIGIAFSSGLAAAPLEALKVKTQNEAVDKIARIYQKLEAEKIVLGIPLDSEGWERVQAQKIKKFGKKLQKAISGKIIFHNEALSSKEALEKKLAAGRGKKARRKLDATSAAVILQDYLDSSATTK